MIGYVRGIVTHLFNDACYVDVHGVGYRVYVPVTTRQHLLEGDEVTLFTYTNVREDAIQLYGFKSQEEYELFILLISVSGIGPKVGLGILTKLPGIGKKSAERLLLELKDKLAKMTSIKLDTAAVIEPIGPAQTGVAGEAIEALVALGYSQDEVSSIVDGLNDGTRDAASLIKESLKVIGKGR